jgi:hypothetical protein
MAVEFRVRAQITVQYSTVTGVGVGVGDHAVVRPSRDGRDFLLPLPRFNSFCSVNLV